MIPHSKYNGAQSYKDYGFQLVYLYDLRKDPQQVIWSGMAPSGENELVHPIAQGSVVEVPGDITNDVGELEPMYTEPGVYDIKATGMLDP